MELAADPDLSLTWFDAVVLRKKAREQCAETWPTPDESAERDQVEEM